VYARLTSQVKAQLSELLWHNLACSIADVWPFAGTYDHRQRRNVGPVRSRIHKPLIGGLVLRWVTTGEYPLLYVLLLACPATVRLLPGACRCVSVRVHRGRYGHFGGGEVGVTSRRGGLHVIRCTLDNVGPCPVRICRETVDRLYILMQCRPPGVVGRNAPADRPSHRACSGLQYRFALDGVLSVTCALYCVAGLD